MPKKMKSLVYEKMGICYIDFQGGNAMCVVSSPHPTLMFVSVLVVAFGTCAALMPIKRSCWKILVWTFQTTRGSNSTVAMEELLVTLPFSRGDIQPT